MVDCSTGVDSLHSPVLMPVYDTKGNTVVMSQVPENLPQPSISVDMPRGRSGRCPMAQKNLHAVLKDSHSENYSGVETGRALMKRLATLHERILR